VALSAAIVNSSITTAGSRATVTIQLTTQFPYQVRRPSQTDENSIWGLSYGHIALFWALENPKQEFKTPKHNYGGGPAVLPVLVFLFFKTVHQKYHRRV
jgi:hypothetical protein